MASVFWLQPTENKCPSFFESVGKCIDNLISQYDNIIIMLDFNVQPHETTLTEFCEIYNLRNLVTQPTCFKSITSPTCIDLILTNSRTSFRHTSLVETGISDHHKMVQTVVKSTLP